MIATSLPSPTRRARNTRLPRLSAMLGACAIAAAASCAFAQTAEPGDIIVERQVMAHDAFQSVPTGDDPVIVRATTFPATTFDQSIATLVTDADLTGAHGSSGVLTSGSGNSASAASLDSITKMLSGSATGSNVAMGPGATAGPTGGIGSTISMSVTGALAPLQGIGGSR